MRSTSLRKDQIPVCVCPCMYIVCVCLCVFHPPSECPLCDMVEWWICSAVCTPRVTVRSLKRQNVKDKPILICTAFTHKLAAYLVLLISGLTS